MTGALILLSLTTLGCQSASIELDTGLVHTFGCWNEFCENVWYGIRSPDKIFCSQPSMACSATIERAGKTMSSCSVSQLNICHLPTSTAVTPSTGAENVNVATIVPEKLTATVMSMTY